MYVLHLESQSASDTRIQARLEHEVREQFADISMRLQHMRFPIILLVGETHVLMTAVRDHLLGFGKPRTDLPMEALAFPN